MQVDALEDLDVDGGCVQCRSLVKTVKNEGTSVVGCGAASFVNCRRFE